MYSRPIIVTGHELFGHGIDANRGISSREGVYGPFISEGKLPIDEWRACYRENILREELRKLSPSVQAQWGITGMNFREYYKKSKDGKEGLGPKLIRGSHKILPEGVKCDP